MSKIFGVVGMLYAELSNNTIRPYSLTEFIADQNIREICVESEFISHPGVRLPISLFWQHL